MLHCISSQSDNPLKDYRIIREELKKFNPSLLEKKEIILLTKSDLGESKLKQIGKESVIPVSVHNWDSIQTLIKIISED